MAAGPTSRSVDFPAPLGGWRTDVPLSDMPKDAAAVMDNWFPEQFKARVRRGFARHATGMPNAAIETLIPYNGTSPKLFAACDDAIYDVTSTGAVGAAEIGSLNSARFGYTSFTNSGGIFIRAVNGADAPLTYDGTSWTTGTYTVTGTGLTASNLVAVTSYRSRLWYIEKNTTKIWYGAVDAISGALTSLEVGSVMKQGGKLIALGVWSVMLTTSITYCLVAMSDQGELVVYQGSNPSSSTDWSLLGTFVVGRPLGDRPFFNAGGDLGIITQDGVISISNAVKLDRAAIVQNSLTQHISPSWSEAVSQYASFDGWEILTFAPSKMVILNIPVPNAPAQFVMNSVTGKWCRFTGIPANTWAVYQDKLYFGGTSIVYQGDIGSADDSAPIEALYVGAYTRLASGIAPKQAKLMTVSMVIGPFSKPYAGVSVDYQTRIPTGTLTVSASGAAVWDVSVWDGAVWAGDLTVRKIISASGIGISMAPTIRAVISGDNASDSGCDLIGGSIVFEVGAPV